jgi:Fe-S-cluster containining protein
VHGLEKAVATPFSWPEKALRCFQVDLNVRTDSNVKECNQCGKCCINYSDGGLSASPSEIEWWNTFRPDIARFVHKGEIWIDPDTKKMITRCPWLRHSPQENKYSCDIYYDRPDDCKHYPVTVEQMINDDCEMLELKDLKQTKQAQKSLDKIMIDSRPARH